ncbi:hypothetical protein PAEPH01_0172 [Pancytospora epiphaga]|nr:hypothetical protein PAEPH01_0172 [Pancytospora epiphaga]
MKFRVDVTGEFHNIAGIRVAQNFHISVECAACGKPYKNLLYITEEMKEQVKVKGNHHEFETFNLVVACRDCENEMHIKIHRPTEMRMVDVRDETSDEPRQMEVFLIKDEACHISTIQSDSAVLLDVDGLILDAVDLDGNLFENCVFKDRVLVEDAKNGKTADIQSFRIRVTEL